MNSFRNPEPTTLQEATRKMALTHRTRMQALAVLNKARRKLERRGLLEELYLIHDIHQLEYQSMVARRALTFHTRMMWAVTVQGDAEDRTGGLWQVVHYRVKGSAPEGDDFRVEWSSAPATEAALEDPTAKSSLM